MMMQALDRLFALLLIVVLLFVIPTYYRFQRQEEINYQMVLTETQKTADLICELGYIESNSLTELEAVLAATGTGYRLTLAHLQKHFSENTETGKLEYYYEGNYNYEIYRKIKADGRYDMDLGDFFYISVENNTPTPFQQLKTMLGMADHDRVIMARSGGLIRAEGL